MSNFTFLYEEYQSTMVLPSEILIVHMYQSFYSKENVQNHSFPVVDCSTKHEVMGALLLSLRSLCLKKKKQFSRHLKHLPEEAV